MYLFKEIAPLQAYLRAQKAAGQPIGFAPTMGALHEGHLSLIRKVHEHGALAVCSIFVNPTQFNEASDLEHYPKTEDKDIEQLLSVGSEVVFLPSVAAIYPKGFDLSPSFDFGKLTERMEGAHRPGHFQGVAQVVHRLLEIVQPDLLFMGQKDFQQFTIIRSMLRQMGAATEFVVCPIQRAADGLALSSRNVRLTTEGRQAAPQIYQTLQWAKAEVGQQSPAAISQLAMERLAQVPAFKPEYVELVDAYSLEPVERFEDHAVVVACAAVWVGEVRLIDNLLLKGSL